MRILPGDPNKQSLKDRGLTFEMILQAIDSGGLLGQLVLAVEIGGYIHAVPCEFRGTDLRIITAFPSRKLNKIYRP